MEIVTKAILEEKEKDVCYQLKDIRENMFNEDCFSCADIDRPSCPFYTIAEQECRISHLCDAIDNFLECIGDSENV